MEKRLTNRSKSEKRETKLRFFKMWIIKLTIHGLDNLYIIRIDKRDLRVKCVAKELLFFTNSIVEKRKRLSLNSAPYKSVGTTTRRLHGRSSIHLEAAACTSRQQYQNRYQPAARSGQTRAFRLEPNHPVETGSKRVENFRIEFLVLSEKNFITRSKRFFPSSPLPEFHRLLCYFARIKTSNLGVKGRGQAISPHLHLSSSQSPLSNTRAKGNFLIRFITRYRAFLAGKCPGSNRSPGMSITRILPRAWWLASAKSNIQHDLLVDGTALYRGCIRLRSKTQNLLISVYETTKEERIYYRYRFYRISCTKRIFTDEITRYYFIDLPSRSDNDFWNCRYVNWDRIWNLLLLLLLLFSYRVFSTFSELYTSFR